MAIRHFTYGNTAFDALVIDERIREVRPCSDTAEAQTALEKLFDLELDFSGCSDFERTVLEKAREIPRGRVATYGEIARALGKPNAPRAVGNALARNRLAIVVPCHRVIRSDMRPGNYTHGEALKVQLLRSEGVGFSGDRVLEKFLHRF